MDHKVHIGGAVALFAERRFARPVDWTVMPGENWAIVGPNGAGKSLLADLLMGRVPLRDGSVEIVAGEGRSKQDVLKQIGFRDIYSVMDCRESYYQQRWNADGRAATPLAGSLFGEEVPGFALELFDRFGLAGALEKHIVSLSSGELRKLLIIRALCSRPEILVIDNPFVGLDESSRVELSFMLGGLRDAGGPQLVLLLSDPAQVPAWVEKVLPVAGMDMLGPLPLGDFLDDGELLATLFGCPQVAGEIPAPVFGAGDEYTLVARLEDVSVRYGDKVVVAGIDWTIARGEKWALLGPNGSGKSTILSLLYGDNPQAYANRISLFDRPRGSGESIWDIKKRIGYLNPDIHSFYLKDISALDVVLSGFYDTIGLYSAGTAQQREMAARWLTLFGGPHLAGRMFVKLSFGEQRLVMLARTFVKCPPVVILDEPLHGLDAALKKRAVDVITRYCSQPGVTLIYVTHYTAEIPPCVGKVYRLGL